MARTVRISGLARDGKAPYGDHSAPCLFYRKEKRFARKLTRRAARRSVRILIGTGNFDALPGTDREAGCCTSGWITH